MTLLPAMRDELGRAAGRLSRRRAARRHTAKVAAMATGGVLALGGAALGAQAVGVWRPSAKELGGRQVHVSVRPPSAEQLRLFGILRRPQTAQDRRYARQVLGVFGGEGPFRHARVRTDYVRVLFHDDDGNSTVLVPVDRNPMLPPRDRTHHSKTNPYWPFKPRPRENALCTVTRHVEPRDAKSKRPFHWAAMGCTDTRRILSAQSFGGTQHEAWGLVPDEVATVRVWRKFHAPLDVPVRDNVVRYHLPHGFDAAGWTTWLDAAGDPVGPVCDARPATCARIGRRREHRLAAWRSGTD